MCVCLFVCMCVCVSVCLHVCVCVCALPFLCLSPYECTCVCVCVYMPCLYPLSKAGGAERQTSTGLEQKERVAVGELISGPAEPPQHRVTGKGRKGASQMLCASEGGRLLLFSAEHRNITLRSCADPRCSPEAVGLGGNRATRLISFRKPSISLLARFVVTHTRTFMPPHTKGMHGHTHTPMETHAHTRR